MKIRASLFVLTVLTLSLLASITFAEQASGTFTTVSRCDAYKSFNKGTNPGLIKTVPGTGYDIVEVNTRQAEWVRVRIPGIEEPLRWVSGECGTKTPGGGKPTESPAVKPGSCSVKGQHDSYVLALTWQPGFCKHFNYSGRKPECDAIRQGTLAVNHMTIHGLWPNRKACGTRYGNCGGQKLELNESTISKLAPWMPNFLYEQVFGAYEWDKHGTCQNLPDDEYFLTILDLAQAVDASAVGSHIKSRVGREMSMDEFFADVKEAYGQETADRIMLLCAGGKYLQEVRINLPLNFKADTNLSVMTKGAARSGARQNGCKGDKIFVESSGPN